MTIVRRPHAVNLVRWARDRPRVLVLSADLTSSCEANDFRDEYPERFFSMGMAEQNLMGFAGGLAREGFVPFVHTFAVFICRRPFDQVAMSIGYPNLPVRLIGFLPGITTPGGVTHQAIDDVALMRAIPNMTILECGDATDVESVLDVTEGIDGPVYVRMLRGEVPRLFPAYAPMVWRQSRVLAEGDDLLVLSSGICTEEALRAVAVLRQRGLSMAHLHVSTLKPFDDPNVVSALRRRRRGVVTLENHSIVGGLGSAVAETMAELGVGNRLVRLGLRDEYAHGASRAYLMNKYGIDALGLVAAVEALLGERFHVEPAELAAMPLEPQAQEKDTGAVVGFAKAEDL
jgi:transketolase